MTDREYRANAEGLNIVFGATLGFVLAASENLATLPFVAVLGYTVGIVVAILYIGASERRWVYSAYAIISIAGLPIIFDPILLHGTFLPSKLQPTLAVWAVVTFLVEFAPRGAAVVEVSPCETKLLSEAAEEPSAKKR